MGNIIIPTHHYPALCPEQDITYLHMTANNSSNQNVVYKVKQVIGIQDNKNSQIIHGEFIVWCKLVGKQCYIGTINFLKIMSISTT